MTDTKSNILTWEQFSIRNSGNTRNAFEGLCKRLFARALETNPAELVVHKNQTGIECEPFQKGSEFWSFQAKYKEEGGVNFSAFRDSINKALKLKFEPERYKGLTHIICYSNKEARERNLRRDEVEKLSESAGVRIIWVYGNAILDRLEEDQFIDLRRKYFGGGQDLELPNPKSKATKTISALKFTAEVPKFIGRDAEREQLDRFMSSEDMLSWWAIEGHGASGKSRLALELCNDYSKEGWNCGFYDKDIAERSSDEWEPERPHLIIFDYALKNEGEPIRLIKIALHLLDKGKISFPVRILLLDRDAKSSIQVIQKTPTLGNKIMEHLYLQNPLSLEPPSREDIQKMIKGLTEYFELSPEERQFVIDYTMGISSTRKILIAGLITLHLHQGGSRDHAPSMEKLIITLIEQEAEKHWRKLGIGKEREKYLLLATIADGIDIQPTSKLGPEAKSFIEEFNFPEQYEIVVGQSAVKRLAPLSHDVVSELYVLDNYKPTDPVNEKQFHEAIKICLQVDGGQGLVGFYTRAANDWPNHPTLNLLLPRFGQTEHQFTVWLVVMSNVIDKINIPIDEKLGIFIRAVWGLIRDSESTFKKLKYVYEGFFLRLLREVSDNSNLDNWVREYVVLDSSTTRLPQTTRLPPTPTDIIPKIEVSPGLKLRSDDYCQAVLTSFVQIDKKLRKNLIWHGLFETYFHAILHKLANRSAALKEVSSLLSEIADTFDDPWSIGIIFRDVIASLVQFGHAGKTPDSAVRIIDWILEELQKRENNYMLASCLSIATTALSFSKVLYDKKKKIISIFDDSFGKDTELDEKIGTEFVCATVALMHGFRDRFDFDFALDLIRRAEQITDIFPNEKNVEHLNMGFGQLARREANIASVTEADDFLSKTISLAKQHGKRIPRIVAKVVQEISTKYTNEIKRDYHKAQTYFDLTIDLCEYFSVTDLGNIKLYPIGLLEGEYRIGLKSRDFVLLRNLADKISRLQKKETVDISNFWQTAISLLSVYQSAKNSGDVKTTEEVLLVAEYWLEHLSDNSQIRDVFSHIIGNR